MLSDGRPTLESVAARAGVSRATASRVLRGSSNVSEAAREAVLRAADEVAYTVNRAARSLVTRRTDSVAFLVAEDQERLFGDPYFPAVLRGAHAEAAAAGFQVVFAIAGTATEAGQFVDFAAGGHVDGVLLVSLHGDDGVADRLERQGVPTVLNGRPFRDDTGLYSVDADNVAGSRAATAALLARGARSVATITGSLDMGAGQDRLAGFRDALAAAGVRGREDLVAPGDFTLDGGARATTTLLDRHPDLDGIFAASDLMALGALRTLAARGRRVPEDVAVIGFDDLREAGLSSPALTTVRQPLDDLGRTMTRVLLARLAGEDAPRRTVLPVDLIRRASA